MPKELTHRILAEEALQRIRETFQRLDATGALTGALNDHPEENLRPAYPVHVSPS